MRNRTHLLTCDFFSLSSFSLGYRFRRIHSPPLARDTAVYGCGLRGPGLHLLHVRASPEQRPSAHRGAEEGDGHLGADGVADAGGVTGGDSGEGCSQDEGQRSQEPAVQRGATQVTYSGCVEEEGFRISVREIFKKG